MIEFTITGKPQSQKRHRHNSITRRIYDPSYIDKKNVWLQIAAYKPKVPYADNLYVKLIFHMLRPRAHFRTGKFKYQLKKNVPYLHSIKPDIDNMAKFYLDIMQGKKRYFLDDGQVSILEAKKIYCFQDEHPYTEISIKEIS